MFLGINMKTRGFEYVSRQEWLKAASKSTNIYCDIILDYSEYEHLELPQRKTSRSAGYDIISPFTFALQPGQDILIPTGFKAYMLHDDVLVFHVRSSHGFKNFIRLANTTGIGDSDYYNNLGNEGHYFIKLRNEGDEVFEVYTGNAIAQCIFMKYLLADGDDYEGIERTGGFGSTGN